ncbi:MAG TPA: TatD family hydrolase [Candidatus Saccharimonadales bacterium]|nr:TatD family hydrolase [Candidatus Saccharimonadales bacterium]
MEFVDTHCHLQFEKLEERLEEVINSADDAGVTRIICVGTNLDDSAGAIKIAAGHDKVWASAGVHPHEADNLLDDNETAAKLAELYKRPKIVAAGEIGLDFYKNYSAKENQEKLLRTQLELASAAGLPCIFHVRDAWDDFWRIFDGYKVKSGVIHSFSAGPDRLEQALSRGLHVALNGIMTYTKDMSQLEAAKKVPDSRLVLETDAPFLTPAPDRWQVCEPKHTAKTAAFLAELRGQNLEELARITTINATKLFGIENG